MGLLIVLGFRNLIACTSRVEVFAVETFGSDCDWFIDRLGRR